MAEGGEKKKGFSRGWSIFRWPLMLAALILSSVMLMIGLACSVGYTGTTPLKALNNSGTDLDYWKNFEALFAKIDLPLGSSKGRPYLALDVQKLSQKEALKTINFDKRSVRVLSYIASGNESKQVCGWNSLSDSRHDRIVININHSYESDLSDPEPNILSSSTLNRGVGARINETDYVKCSYLQAPPPDCDGQWHLYNRNEIILSSPYVKENPRLPTVMCPILIECATDYYPHNPIGGPPGEILAEGQSPSLTDAPIIKNLNPDVKFVGTKNIQPELLKTLSREAAVYKTAQMALHLMTFDYPGCEKSGGNVGNQRNTPTSIIFAQWIAEEMKKEGVWDGFMSLANGNNPLYKNDYAAFPYHLQTESPLAGLSFDSKLNNVAGLHFNY